MFEPFISFFTEVGKKGNAVARHPYDLNHKGLGKVIISKSKKPKPGEIWFGWIELAPCEKYYFFHPVKKIK